MHGLTAAQDQIRGAELLYPAGQGGGEAKGIRTVEGGIADQGGLVRSHGEPFAKRADRRRLPRAQHRYRATRLLPEGEGDLQGIFVIRADDEGMAIRPLPFERRIDLELTGGKLRVDDLFDTDDDAHHVPASSRGYPRRCPAMTSRWISEVPS